MNVCDFFKAPFELFLRDSKALGFVDNNVSPELVRLAYDRIRFPVMQTTKTQDVEFYLPYPFCVQRGAALTIPTGLHIEVAPGIGCVLSPVSFLSFEKSIVLKGRDEHLLVTVQAKENHSFGEGDRYMTGIFVGA